MNLSHQNLAVSRKHQAVSESILPGFSFNYVTNGVHHRTWTAPTIQNLFDRFISGWLDQPELLINAPSLIPPDILWDHHQDAKAKLVKVVNHHLTAVSDPNEREHPLSQELFDTDTLTISLARRPVGYKRPLLLYTDLERFVRLGTGKIQVIQCGKSHPDDDTSQAFVRQIVSFSKKFKDVLRIVFLENYSPKITRILVSGSDIWLNTPKRPLEASGTSGMKAALNGVINFSVLDGWWIEGYERNPQAGFTIGDLNSPNDDIVDSNDLYTKLEQQILPLYYHHRREWQEHMLQAISLGAYFNTHRAVKQYQQKAWNT